MGQITMGPANEPTSLQNLPGILFIGSSNVGKRTLLSRLLSVDFEDASDSPSDILARRWTINTKYYTADVSVWMTHPHDQFSFMSLPLYNTLTALVMVFDLNDLSSFAALQEWVSRIDLQKFEILLCIGNKVDLISGHPVHAEYRRRLLKNGESSSYPYTELSDFGIAETEGSSLLGNEEPDQSASDIKRSFTEWCSEHNIEYIEACASNADFDKCLSADGDSQGVERLFGALSAHMWPGMILKSGNKITPPTLSNKEDISEEESDYEFEYEVLSAGSAEPWDDTHGGWVSANGSRTVLDLGESVGQSSHDMREADDKFDEELQPSTSMVELKDEKEAAPDVEEPSKGTEVTEVSPFEFEDLDQLMSEIGNIRGSLRLMPDFQRREMAAKLAMKMAAMFGGGSDDEEECD